MDPLPKELARQALEDAISPIHFLMGSRWDFILFVCFFILRITYFGDDWIFQEKWLIVIKLCLILWSIAF